MPHVLPILLFCISLSNALRFPLRSIQQKSSFRVAAVVNDDNSLDLSTVHDLLYMANVTLGGTVYPVQLDTGSSDLWIKGTSSPLPNSQQTDQTYNLTYGIGWAYGHVSYASMEFAGISVSKQAFLDVSSAQNPALGYGADGILGLGFTSLSTVDALVNGTGSSDGRSPLYNLFADNPSQPNFISFALQRSTQDGDDVEGSFTIGELESKYADVANQPAIPTWPVNSPKRWNVLLDAVLIGDTTVTPSTTVPNAPANKAVVLLDSGTSYTYAPEEICNAIYGGISGASYNAALGQWVVPCDAEIDMALQFNGEIYALHPLDVNPKSLSDATICVGSFVPQSVAVGAGQFDWLIGDNFLRSVYSVYDFGDFDSNNVMGDPYVKLLSLIDPNGASAEFVAVRGGNARTNITYNASNEGSADSSSTSVTLSTDVARTLDQIGRYFPAMLGVVALNALALISLLVFGIVFLCRRRRRKTIRARTPLGRTQSPIPMDPRSSYIAGEDPEQHSYEPVSMAITDNTMFVPPSPGFKKFDGSDRPRSLASLPSHSRLYQQISSEDLDAPPSPGFYKDSRPMSVGILPSQTSLYNPEKGKVPEDQPFLAPKISFQQAEETTTLGGDNQSIRSETQRTVDIVDESRDIANEQSPFLPPSPTRSVHSQISRVNDSMDLPRGSTSTPPFPARTPTPPESAPAAMATVPSPASSTLRPILRTQLSDRPHSAMFPSASQARLSEDSPPPRPMSGLRPLRLSETHRPMSALVPGVASGTLTPPRGGFPLGPNSAPPLRPILRSQTSDDRPKNAVAFTPERMQTYPPPSREIPMAPIQVPEPVPAPLQEFTPQIGVMHPPGDEAVLMQPNPPFLQRSSPLRQAAGRPMSVGVFGLADGGELQPPNPAFRAQGPSRQSSSSSLRPNPNGQGGDRPMSIA